MYASIKIIFCFTLWLLFGVCTIFLCASILSKQEMKHEYDFSVELFDLRSAHEGKYTSGDSITDVFMNYFSGKYDLPLEMKAKILYYKEKEVLEYLTKDTSSMRDTYIEVLHIYNSWDIQTYISIINRSDKNIEKHFTWIPDSINRDALYHAVWKIYFECGSPKIKVDLEPNSQFLYRFGIDEHYDPFSNTMYIHSPYEEYALDFSWHIAPFFEELGHSKQFKERKWSSYISYCKGVCRTFYRKKRYEKYRTIDISIENSYNIEYTKEGSFEYEAHSVLMYKIIDKFYTFLNYEEEIY